MDKHINGEYKIIFLHHSTGAEIYNAGNFTIRRINKLFRFKSFVNKWFNNYNRMNETNYKIEEQYFPKRETYGWNNYPYDYYNIWVKNAGDQHFMNEPTLEILTRKYNLIIFKHCFPVCNILADINQPDLESSEKRIENFKLQYNALKQKLHEFPNTKFLLWTGAAQVQTKITKEQAIRAKYFFQWVINEWNTPTDNVFIWDFYQLETEGNDYMKTDFAINSNNSHPNRAFAKRASTLFCERIINVIEQNK